MVSALNEFEGKSPSPLTAADVRRLAFGEGAAFSVIVAETAGRAEGYIAFYPGYDLESASAGFHMQDLFVEAAFRQQGVGRALVSALVAEAKRQGRRWIEWHAMTKNDSATAFYDRLGAKRDPLIPFRLGRHAMARWRD